MNKDIKQLLLPKYHGTIVGSTGSGKTYFANTLYEAIDAPCVFFNPSTGRKDDYGISGVEMEFPSRSRNNFDTKLKKNRLGFKTAMRDNRNVKYDQDYRKSKAKKEFKRLYELAKEVCKEFDTDVWFFVDEAHKFVGTDADEDNPFIEAASEGRDKGIHVMFISQRAAKIHEDALAECDKQTVFRSNIRNKGYFQYYGMPYDEMMELIKDAGDHHFVIWNEGEMIEKSGKKAFKV